MKKITLLLCFIGAFALAQSQSVLYYNFQNSLNEVNGAGPALTVLGNTGTFVIDTLNEIGGSNKMAYRFEKNNGLQFNNTAAGNFINESYTIELYFVFDELSSWKRVVDWKNRKTDWGAYVYYGELNFYNILYSNEAPVAAGEYTYYVITRDAESKKVLIYTDAEVKIDFIDNNGDALVDGDGFLNFFYDDLVVPNEASSGAVAMLKLYNHVLDSSSIKTNWNTIGSSVFGINDALQNLSSNLYPNPASDQISVDLSGFKGSESLKLTIVNQSGQKVYETTTNSAANTFILPITSYSKGLYILRLDGGGRYSSSKFMIK